MKSDDPLSLGGVARQLHGRFDGLGSGVGQINLLVFWPGRDGGQFIHQFDHRGIIEIAAARMDQGFGLFDDGCRYVGVAMPGCAYRNPGGEIEETVPIHILHD